MARISVPAASGDGTPVTEVLEREARWRTRAGLASGIAALLTLSGGVLSGLLYVDFPRVLLLDALRDAAGQPIGRPGLKTLQIQFYDDKMVQLLLLSLALAVGALLLLGPLLFLYQATLARRPELPRLALYAAVSGPVLVGVSEILLQIVVAVQANDFVNGDDLGSDAAQDALRSDFIVIAQIMRQLGLLALGLAFVLIALNAMRAGLLTRFLGILGVIVGVLFVIPLGGQLPVVQAFWLSAVGWLILGRWPGGTPRAWEEGVAVPWPTQQELREERERELARREQDVADVRASLEADVDEVPSAPDARPSGDPSDPRGPTPGPATPSPHPSSKKKKRKRR